MDNLKYMHRALKLASQGMGYVSPNPMVGCVLVYNDQIIGEGFHQKCGQPHAEVHAIKQVKNKMLYKKSTLFVTLEPCSHQGKTPPCTRLIIEKEIPEVVIATQDPNVLINGQGVDRLRESGVHLTVGVLKKEAIELNKRFFTFHQKKRPFVTLKWAQTADGFIAKDNRESKWISNPYARQLAHKWRTEEDAILIGKNTALFDNPSLTARDWMGNNPVRILLDSNLTVSENTGIFSDLAKTIIINRLKTVQKNTNVWVAIEKSTPQNILEVLYHNNIMSVMVEGGSQTISSFIQSHCWDEARVFKSKRQFGKGIPAPHLQNARLVNMREVGNDELRIYKP